MRRMLMVMAAAALMATMMVVSAMPAFAFANPVNNGNAEDAPGQTRASALCGTFPTSGHVGRQVDANLPSNGHKRTDTTFAPTNCNHFFQLS